MVNDGVLPWLAASAVDGRGSHENKLGATVGASAVDGAAPPPRPLVELHRWAEAHKLRSLLKRNGISYHKPGRANLMKSKIEMAADLMELMEKGLKTAEQVAKELASGGGERCSAGARWRVLFREVGATR